LFALGVKNAYYPLLLVIIATLPIS
jgi:hypothetical protein